MNKIKVYTLQGKWTGDFDSNNKWYKDEALKLKGKDIDLLVLPELFHTPYFPFEENADFFDLAIEKDHPIVAEWQAIAKELHFTGFTRPYSASSHHQVRATSLKELSP